MKLPIYLDYAATTPIHDSVMEKMLPYFQHKFGNSGSQQHIFGWEADEAIEQARISIANYFQLKPRQLIFTSGATESNNLAIQGFLKNFNKPGHLITSKTEHKSVLEVYQHFETVGWEVTYLSVNSIGEISLEELIASIRKDTHLISIMWVNNETGCIQPISDIVSIAKEKQIVFHCDATQALGKIELSDVELPDLITFSGHKIYAPKGIGGVLISNEQVSLKPIVFGGNQERGLRSGTLPTQQIVGLAAAFSLIPELLKRTEFYKLWNHKFVKLLHGNFSTNTVVNSSTDGVPHILNFSVQQVDWEEMFEKLHKIAVSNGSACNAKSKTPSHVLTQMGLSNNLALSSIRLSMGLQTTEEELQYTLNYLEEQLNQL